MTFIIASVVLFAAVSSAQFQVPALGPGYAENPGDSLFHGFSSLASGIPQRNGFGGSAGLLGNIPDSFQRHPLETGFQNPIASGFGNGFRDVGKHYATGSPYSHPNILGKAVPSGVTEWNSPVSDLTFATQFDFSGNDQADHQALWPSDTHLRSDRNIVSTAGQIDNDSLLPHTINKAGQDLGVNIQTTTTAPITSAPVTSISVTSAPITSAPVTSISITSAPITSAPVTVIPITSASVTSDQNSLASNSIPTTKTQNSSSAAATSTGNVGALTKTVSVSASASSVTGGDGASQTPSVSPTASNGQSSSGASSSASTAQSSIGASAGQSTSASTSAGSQ